MLALIPDVFRDIDALFLEPACGHGNFLVAILARKLSLVSEQEHGGTPNWYEFATLRAVASIYAIDISEDNVLEARERMRALLDKEFAGKGHEPTPEFSEALGVILSANVVRGHTLEDASLIRLVEWAPGDDETFVRTPSYLEDPEFDLFNPPPEPLPAIHYRELTSAMKP
ncbi:MAG: hypothetical protein JWM89_4054 [Acidimicrobiales bacterium]|nr:hypothetical protein [Acidimicrobiales bacterium]